MPSLKRKTRTIESEQGIVVHNPEYNYPITPQLFKLFVKECRYWLSYFGLTAWEVIFVQEDKTAEDTSARAWCSIEELSDRQVVMGIARVWDIAPDLPNISKVAFHEVLELLTMRLFVLAATGVVMQIREENHALIRTLENSVFVNEFSRRMSAEKRKRK